jgi:phospholipid/cholesterol/gamma-HCH transport system substrate-binding protein
MKNLVKPLSLAIGLALLLGATVLAYQATKSDETYEVTAYFEKAIGLFANSDVDILGVPVGKVRSVEPEGTKVKVVMDINAQYKVPADAIAQIVPISVIADRYVQLAPVYEPGEEALKDGAVIEVDHTYIPAELDDVFKQLKKLLDAIEPGKAGEPGALGALIVQLNETLKDREEQLKGTLISGAKLTGTLADAKGDIGGLLVNLEDLFTRLATRSGEFGQLNANFADVMTALAESRDDITGTLANLGTMTEEVGDLLKAHGDRLGQDLRLAVNILSTVLKNRTSVEESLQWLPVVGLGAANAYHGGEFKDVDVRDNSNAKLECEILKPLPASPVKDQLKEICRGETGEPPPNPRGAAPNKDKKPTLEIPITPVEALQFELNCDKGVRRVKRQLRRVDGIGLPDEVMNEVIDPLNKQLRKLKKKCREVGKQIEDEGLLDGLTGVGDVPEVGDGVGLGGLTGSAAGTAAAAGDSPSSWDRFGDWVGGLFGFIGVGG